MRLGNNADELTHRLTHLKSLMCFAYSYNWDCILNIHEEVLTEIERGNRKSSDNFSDIESLNLLVSSQKRENNKDADSSSDTRVWFCSKFQKGECNKTSPHAARIGNSTKMVKHICATCYLKDRLSLEHKELSDKCPHRA